MRESMRSGRPSPTRPNAHPLPVVNNYSTLHALVREWRSDLNGTTVRDVYSQNKNELTAPPSATVSSFLFCE